MSRSTNQVIKIVEELCASDFLDTKYGETSLCHLTVGKAHGDESLCLQCPLYVDMRISVRKHLEAMRDETN